MSNSDLFSSLSGNYDYMSSMSSLLGDYNTIKSGAYSSLMKSYVNKVGNKAALTAYQETGSTTTAASSSSESTKSSSSSSFLDNYFKSKTESAAKSNSSSSTSTASDTATTTDAYAKYKSSWLDDHLSQYNKDASKTTAADTSVSVDTTI